MTAILRARTVDGMASSRAPLSLWHHSLTSSVTVLSWLLACTVSCRPGASEGGEPGDDDIVGATDPSQTPSSSADSKDTATPDWETGNDSGEADDSGGSQDEDVAASSAASAQ